MNLLKWISGLLFLCWLISLIFRARNNSINNLLIIALVIFIIDILYIKQKPI